MTAGNFLLNVGGDVNWNDEKRKAVAVSYLQRKNPYKHILGNDIDILSAVLSKVQKNNSDRRGTAKNNNTQKCQPLSRSADNS